MPTNSSRALENIQWATDDLSAARAHLAEAMGNMGSTLQASAQIADADAEMALRRLKNLSAMLAQRAKASAGTDNGHAPTNR